MSPSLGDSAHIRGTATYRSPIEDQAVAVYQAARRLAQAKRFRPHTHNGPHGAVKGVSGPMVLSRLVRQLFPEYSEENFKTAYSIINQALRKTDAMVCLRRPAGDPQHRDPKDLPIWFIADKMPDHLVVVTLAQARKSADVTQQPTQFDEKKFLTPRERRVSAEEAGETQTPGEVTVTKTDQKSADQLRAEALAAQREKVAQEAERFRARLLEEIQTNPVPLTTQDLRQLLDGDEFTFHHTTYRDSVKRLAEEGLIVGRKETDAERRLRGGGSMPKGGRSTLWAPAPGPVPLRTKLPDGVQPYKSAQDWDNDKRAQREVDMNAILEFIQTEQRDRRRRNRMIDALGLTEDRFDSAIRELEATDRVYSNQGRFYVKRHSAKTTDAETENPLPTMTPVDTVQTAPSPTAVTDGDQENLEIVLNLAAKLGVTLPKGNERRVTDLESQVTTLQTENARLSKQVEALKAAIAALA